MSKIKDWLEWNFGIGSDWSIKHILTIIGILIIIILVVYILNPPDKSRERKLLERDCFTTGTVYRIEPKEAIAHGFFGSRTKTLGYTVYISYEVSGKIYKSEEYLLNVNSNNDLIRFIFKNLGREDFKIKYSHSNPENGMIFIK